MSHPPEHFNRQKKVTPCKPSPELSAANTGKAQHQLPTRKPNEGSQRGGDGSDPPPPAPPQKPPRGAPRSPPAHASERSGKSIPPGARPARTHQGTPRSAESHPPPPQPALRFKHTALPPAPPRSGPPSGAERRANPERHHARSGTRSRRPATWRRSLRPAIQPRCCGGPAPAPIQPAPLCPL